MKSASILIYSALVELSPSNSAYVCVCVWISRCWLPVPGCSCMLDSSYILDNVAELYMTSSLYNSIISLSLSFSLGMSFFFHIFLLSHHFQFFFFLLSFSLPFGEGRSKVMSSMQRSLKEGQGMC